MLDRSQPPHVADVRVMGSVLRIVCPDAETLVDVRDIWHLCLVETDCEPLAGQVVLEVTAPGDAMARRRALSRLTQRVTKEAIRLRAGHSLLLHAAGLSHPSTGASAVFVARGGTGKTTIVRALGTRYGYLSDETIAVGLDGSIEPYPKPLSVVREDGRGKDEVPPRRLGLRGPRVQPRLTALFALRRVASHEGIPEVVRVDLFDAIAMLAPETSSLAALSKPLHAFADVINLAGGLQLVTYREASTLASLVETALGEER